MIARNPHNPLRTIEPPHGERVVRTPNAHLRDDLSAEVSIEWAPGFDPAAVRFVREFICDSDSRRRGRPSWKLRAGRCVGWTNLAPGQGRRSTSRHVRRHFWIADHDPAPGGTGGPYDHGGAPCEAVDPLLLNPGVPGACTERSWGRPLAAEAKS
jgi:hypothetical protein